MTSDDHTVSVMHGNNLSYFGPNGGLRLVTYLHHTTIRGRDFAPEAV